MIRCEKCGKAITTIKASCFNRDGSDYHRLFNLKEINNAVIFETNSNWAGYELTEKEQRECIYCPNCNNYPFKDEEIHVYDRVEVVMFKGEQQNELQAGDIVTTPLGNRAIIIGIEEWNETKLASIYSEYYALPQMFPVQDLKATGVHKDVKSMLLDLLKENANEQDS